MSVDLMLPAGEKITLVLEAIGDDKIRVNNFPECWERGKGYFES
jgi:hypothetical protein